MKKPVAKKPAVELQTINISSANPAIQTEINIHPAPNEASSTIASETAGVAVAVTSQEKSAMGLATEDKLQEYSGRSLLDGIRRSFYYRIVEDNAAKREAALASVQEQIATGVGVNDDDFHLFMKGVFQTPTFGEKKGGTPLVFATFLGESEIAQSLLQQGAHANSNVELRGIRWLEDFDSDILCDIKRAAFVFAIIFCDAATVDSFIDKFKTQEILQTVLDQLGEFFACSKTYMTALGPVSVKALQFGVTRITAQEIANRIDLFIKKIEAQPGLKYNSNIKDAIKEYFFNKVEECKSVEDVFKLYDTNINRKSVNHQRSYFEIFNTVFTQTKIDLIKVSQYKIISLITDGEYRCCNDFIQIFEKIMNHKVFLDYYEKNIWDEFRSACITALEKNPDEAPARADLLVKLKDSSKMPLNFCSKEMILRMEVKT